MRQLVDEHHGGTGGEDRIDIEIVGRCPVEAEQAEPGVGEGSAVGTDAPDHHIGTPALPADRLVEHRARGADARSGSQVHAQTTSLHVISVPCPRP